MSLVKKEEGGQVYREIEALRVENERLRSSRKSLVKAEEGRIREKRALERPNSPLQEEVEQLTDQVYRNKENLDSMLAVMVTEDQASSSN